METKEKASSKSFEYGVGALVVLVVSIGAAAIVYSLILPFNLLNLPAWILGPLGIYTIIYSVVAGKDLTYYLVWGTVMLAIAVISAFYNVASPFAILGVLAIAIAIIGIVAYQRSKK